MLTYPIDGTYPIDPIGKFADLPYRSGTTPPPAPSRPPSDLPSSLHTPLGLFSPVAMAEIHVPGLGLGREVAVDF